jgi:hypothetical protein
MPKVRDWMRDWAWAVNVIVCAIFVVLILACAGYVDGAREAFDLSWLYPI